MILERRNGEKFLIVRELDGDCLLVESLADGKARSELVEVLIRDWMNGDIILRGAPDQDLKSVAELNPRERLERMSEAGQEKTLRKEKILKAIEGLPSTPARIERHLARIWEQLRLPGPPPKGKSVCTWRRKLKQANGDVQALAPKDCNKGRRPVVLHPETKSAIWEGISQAWLKRERRSRKRVWEIAYELSLSKNRARLPEDQFPLPTQHQVRKELQSLGAYEDFAARHGKDAARNCFRSVQHDTRVERALQEVQFDHTLIDAFALDDRTLQPRGRPWLTVCIDRLTRCIVGIWIGFSPPSYSTLAKCLRHAILPKLDLKVEYPDLVNDWAAFGVPETAVVDNGLEFHGHNFERVCRRLGTVTAMAPRRSGWSKGVVERIFKTFNDDLLHGIPGTTYSNIIERGDYDSKKRAVVRFSVLRRIVIKFIVDVYHQRPHSALHTTPAEMWRMHPPEIRLPCSVDDLKHLFDKTETRSLSERGVRMNDLYYNSPELAQMVRTVGKSKRVEVGYDPDDLTHVRVTHVETGWTLEVPALHQDYAEGLDEWLHNVIKRWTKDKEKDVTDVEHLLKSKREIDELVQEEIARNGKRSRKRLHRALRSDSTTRDTASATETVGPESNVEVSDPERSSDSGDWFEPSKEIGDYPDLEVFRPSSGGE